MPATPRPSPPAARRRSSPRNSGVAQPLLRDAARDGGRTPTSPGLAQGGYERGTEDDDEEEGGRTDGGAYGDEPEATQNSEREGTAADTGTASEPELQPIGGGPPHVEPMGGGYMSDTLPLTQLQVAMATQQQQAISARPPRAQHLSRASLAFGGATCATRRSAAASHGVASSRTARGGIRAGGAVGAGGARAELHRLRTAVEVDDADPLVWTGGSPPPAPPLQPPSVISINSGFSLPPLLSGSAAGINGGGGSSVHDPSKILRCTSYCCALALDLIHLYRVLDGVHGLPCQMHKDGLNAVLHCRESNGRDGDAHSFFFSYGCVVTWGLSELSEAERLQLLVTAGCAKEPIAEHEVDDFGYTHVAGGKAGLAKDVISLETLDVREKLAVSFALAQSVKLGVFERTVEQTIQETRTIPERMAIDGKIKLTRTSITKRIGQLFVDRASINLHSDILDHPEFFWEDDEWLPLYLRAAKYLEIDRRAEVLNKRLDIIKELFDMLASELHNNHSNKLEWIVIILIMIEVFFQVVQLIVFHGDI